VPGSDLPQASLFPEADKVVHFGLYAVLGLLSARAARNSGAPNASTFVRVTLAIAAFAALDEIHQQFIPGREMDVLDWMADLAGAIVGILLFQMARRRREQLT
jgi:VanZ family protein